jgi:hypothetical protein
MDEDWQLGDNAVSWRDPLSRAFLGELDPRDVRAPAYGMLIAL